MCWTVAQCIEHNVDFGMHPFNLLPGRFCAKIAFDDCGCWAWTGQWSRNGYGRAWWKGAWRAAHRVIWEILIGPIPANMVLDHVKSRCRRRECVNPSHMEPVTPRENTLRGEAVLFQKSSLDTVASFHYFDVHDPDIHPLCDPAEFDRVFYTASG